mmetsp:Transcript_65463/g.147605  ORF Transcript_65463/g.147605 Transcript_65463/m.147605 type:complete len:97 (-) Transcript_65463:288-578(-)
MPRLYGRPGELRDKRTLTAGSSSPPTALQARVGTTHLNVIQQWDLPLEVWLGWPRLGPDLAGLKPEFRAGWLDQACSRMVDESACVGQCLRELNST